MKTLLLCSVLSLAMISSANAHHSTTAYDHTKKITLSGTVKEFQWTNPHSWIQVLVTDASGHTVEWSVETGAPNLNVRHGWKRDDLKFGDKVSMVIYPIKDGTPHGTLSTVTLPDGRVLDGAADFIGKDLARGVVNGPIEAPPPPAPGR